MTEIHFVEAANHPIKHPVSVVCSALLETALARFINPIAVRQCPRRDCSCCTRSWMLSFVPS